MSRQCPMGMDSIASNGHSNNLERRNVPRFGMLECGVLWLDGDSGPKRLCPVVITNASIGGVQLRSKEPPPQNARLFLELGTADGALYLPGEVRYVSDDDGVRTFGFKFVPETEEDRQAIAQYVVMLANQASSETLDWSAFRSTQGNTTPDASAGSH